MTLSGVPYTTTVKHLMCKEDIRYIIIERTNNVTNTVIQITLTNFVKHFQISYYTNFGWSLPKMLILEKQTEMKWIPLLVLKPNLKAI